MSYLFDGSNDKVVFTDPAGGDITSAGTVMAWIKRNAAVSDREVVRKDNNWILRHASSDRVDCFYWDNTNIRRHQGVTNSIAALDTWAMVAMGVTGNDVTKIYLNSSDISQSPSTLSSASRSLTGDLIIGNDGANTSGYVFSGRIAEIAIWDVLLSGSEITSLAGGTNPQDVQAAHLKFYAPLKTDLVATVGSLTGTASGGAAQDADHPTISAPSGGGGSTQGDGSNIMMMGLAALAASAPALARLVEAVR